MAEILNTEERTIEGPGAVEWQGITNATVARSATFAHGGSSSLAITATTAAGTDTALLVRPAASAGLTYTAGIWLRNTIAHFPAAYIRFYDTGGGLLTQTALSGSESTSAWYQFTGNAVAPANTTNVDVFVQHFGNSAGDISYIDDISLDDGTAGNVAPTADAGPDQAVTVGALVTLTGAASSDSDGTITAYNWDVISGPGATLSDETVVSPTFTPASAGTYVFGLVVTDDDAATSTQDTVTITVSTPATAEANVRIGGAWVTKPIKARAGGAWV